MPNTSRTEGKQIDLTDEETEVLRKSLLRPFRAAFRWVCAVAATYAVLRVVGHEVVGNEGQAPSLWVLWGAMAVSCWLAEEHKNVLRGISRAYDRALRAPAPVTPPEIEDRLTIKEVDALHSYLSVNVQHARHWAWGAVAGFLLIPAGLVLALGSRALHSDLVLRLAFPATFLGMFLAAVSFHFMDRAMLARVVQKYDAALRGAAGAAPPTQSPAPA